MNKIRPASLLEQLYAKVLDDFAYFSTYNYSVECLRQIYKIPKGHFFERRKRMITCAFNVAHASRGARRTKSNTEIVKGFLAQFIQMHGESTSNSPDIMLPCTLLKGEIYRDYMLSCINHCNICYQFFYTRYHRSLM